MERPSGEPEARLASRLLVSFQYVHVQLAGGAPWGFTLKGGLEHGEPLIVSKVEDGGKAALSQKMRPGDELVNINGTPLYGSRQEALILIKGSFRTLKMIIRRRNVPVVRPHSWHLAKLSEVRTEATTMHFPADAFSLSWHSGCESSDLPLSWTPLLRHCSTDKSGSLGSMESVEQPSQTYYEGSLSPIDQAMDQNKRDSAYSSFSASSNTSDCAVRPEESSHSVEGTQLPEARYLQTGSEVGGEPSGAVSSSASQFSPGTRDSRPAKAAAATAPEPPVRQDSLRACNPPPQGEPLHPKGHWPSDSSLCARGRDSVGPAKEPLPTDQYYLLSSHADQDPPMEKGALLNEEGEQDPQEEPASSEEAGMGSHGNCPSPWQAGPLGHRHSAPEHLLAAQLQALDVAPSQEGPHWTVSPLHEEQGGCGAVKPWRDQDHQAQEAARQGAASPQGSRPALARPRSASVELPSALPLQPPRDAGAGREGAGRDAEGSRPAARRRGPAQHRSAQMRRHSDRFATNLRNEIQWRKAQLQKGKGSPGLLCEEEPPGSPPAPSPLPPLVESKPTSMVPPKRWGSELSVLGAREGGPWSPSRWRAPPKEPKALPLAPGSSGGHWRWSPEHKLQPHQRSLQVAEPSEESGLLPFADRRKFFEETSKHLSPPQHSRPAGALRPPRVAPRDAFQPAQDSEHWARRRHSIDRQCSPPASPPTYQDFRAEAPAFFSPPARHGDCQCWRPAPCSCTTRDTCAYCCGEWGPPVPAGHCAHHCHPRPWSCCRECCCPTQHKLVAESGVPWQARKTFRPEFPVGEWELPAINRKNSQSMSELAQHKMGLARVSPFWTHLEEAAPEWAPVCRASSTHNLSWDCDRPGQAAESPAHEEGAGEPQKPPLRERAYSESHLCPEPARVPGRERREASLARLEEAGPELPPCAARKKGPPPPRPPPPNWEKYHPRRASHHQLLPSEAGLSTLPADSQPPSGEAARQRSQSLPLEHLWGEAAQQPQELPSLAELGSRRYYSHGSPRRTPEWPTPELSEESGSSRPASSLDEEATLAPSWAKGQTGASSKTPEKLPSRPASPPPTQEPEPAQEGRGGGRCPLGPAPPPPSRLNSEELMRDVAGRDRSLAGVLRPPFGLVTAAEVIGDLFSPSEGPAWKGQEWQLQAGAEGAPNRQQTTPASPSCGGAASPTTCSAYYNTSTGKAELLNKMKELPEGAGTSSEEEELDHDLAQKKVQLIESISRKLVVLQEAQQDLQDDLSANVALGKEVESRVKAVCRPQELEKFRLFIGDLDKVVNLLLSLSGRLARVENALGGLDSAAPEEEKLALLEKRRQLVAQLEDAKELQEHVARRERLVSASVSRCLPSEQLQDYQHFVRMKSALVTQQRQLDDKIKLGEEQLRCLHESLRWPPREY